MAKRITELPAAASANPGDLMEISQGAVSKKVDVAALLVPYAEAEEIYETPPFQGYVTPATPGNYVYWSTALAGDIVGVPYWQFNAGDPSGFGSELEVLANGGGVYTFGFNATLLQTTGGGSRIVEAHLFVGGAPAAAGVNFELQNDEEEAIATTGLIAVTAGMKLSLGFASTSASQAFDIVRCRMHLSRVGP